MFFSKIHDLKLPFPSLPSLPSLLYATTHSFGFIFVEPLHHPFIPTLATFSMRYLDVAPWRELLWSCDEVRAGLVLSYHLLRSNSVLPASLLSTLRASNGQQMVFYILFVP